MTAQKTSTEIVADNGDELPSNHSGNPSFQSILQARLSRRDVLIGSLGTAALGLLAGKSALAGDKDEKYEDYGFKKGKKPRPPKHGPKLGFEALPVGRTDGVILSPGYIATPFLPWGTPITGSYPEYLEGGLNSGADQAQQMGMHHDGMHYFPIDVLEGGESSEHGIICINHEYIDQNMMHPNGPSRDANGNRLVDDEVRKEIAAHGVAVVEIKRDEYGDWDIVRGGYNRRITAETPCRITGPVRRTDFVKTKYSPRGTRTRGTLNNCSHGFTPWGTYLTCEENWAGYFFNTDAEKPREQSRYGVPSAVGRYGWGTVSQVEEFARFNASTLGNDATEDYRNEPNTFGWIVEIDPFRPNSMPKKRTAMGRFAHEGVVFGPIRNGQPVVAYSGDDARFEYIYKFVSRRRYYKKGNNRNLLNSGRLFVAKFSDDGSGEWIELRYGKNGLTPENGFSSQADVLVNTRTAADFVGATRMDRPEWAAVHPENGEVYFTLTNNSRRAADDVDAANPRGPNATGHIIRWREKGNRPWAKKFNWDIFLIAGDPREDATVTLDEEDRFASPDGLWFDYRGVLWIQTDMSGSQQFEGPFGNNQMLAVDPDNMDIRRFLIGPTGCEVTGVHTTPDGETLFCNMQHPGEGSSGADPSTNWPGGPGERPRSSTVIVTKDGGGVVGT